MRLEKFVDRYLRRNTSETPACQNEQDKKLTRVRGVRGMLKKHDRESIQLYNPGRCGRFAFNGTFYICTRFTLVDAHEKGPTTKANNLARPQQKFCEHMTLN